MKNLKKQLDSVLEKALNRVIKNEAEEWPPLTAPIYFQPQRPDRPAEKTED